MSSFLGRCDKGIKKNTLFLIFFLLFLYFRVNNQIEFLFHIKKIISIIYNLIIDIDLYL